MKKKNTIFSYIFLSILAILFLMPLAWLFISSFNEEASSALVLPEKWTFNNFKAIMEEPKIISGFQNSLIISISVTFFTVLLSIMAAYPLSRFNFKIAGKITVTLLFLTSIPITAVMVPVYQLFIQLKLVDSTYGVILFMTTSSLPYGIWMTKNFLDGVGIELEEAAWIDGASKAEGVFHVVLPLMLPGIFTVTMFTFVSSWGNFFVPFILLNSVDKLPASVNIYRFFGEHGYIAYGQLCAFSFVYMIPVFILYFFTQNYMSRGFIQSGATKA